MNTILTDDEISAIVVEMIKKPPTAVFWCDLARAIEAAVLAKLAQQPPDIEPDEAFELGLERVAYYTHPTPLAAAPEAPAQGIDKETQTMKLLALVDDLIERDPDKAERFIESALARNALRKRLMEKKAAIEAPAQGKPNDYDPLIEQSLAALIDLICPDLDSGDIVRDAQEAMRELNRRAAALAQKGGAA